MQATTSSAAATATRNPHTAPSPRPAPAWIALREKLHTHMQARAAELNAEVRRYPGPIARCDDQLPKLLDQRAHAMSLLRRLADAAPDGLPDATATRVLLAQCGATDDDTERSLRAELHEALDAARRAEYGYGSDSGRRA